MSFLNTKSYAEELVMVLSDFFTDPFDKNQASFKLNSTENGYLLYPVVYALQLLPWKQDLIVSIKIVDLSHSLYKKKLSLKVALTEVEILLDDDMIEELGRVADLEDPDLFRETELLIEHGIQVFVLEKIKSITSFGEPILV